MKIWVVLEANNLDTDIWISDPFCSEEQASKHLLERYEDNVLELGEDNIEFVRHNNAVYSILTYGNDYYYGVVRSIDIKEDFI